MKLTRRKLATVLVSATAMAAQPPQSTPAPAPDSDLKTARDRLQANARALDGAAIPMATEPAFQFKA
ncbi:MAG: hypothetical protein ABSC05_18290 [Candidatus Solibacter sp.]|jgi:hypothetical protein